MMALLSVVSLAFGPAPADERPAPPHPMEAARGRVGPAVATVRAVGGGGIGTGFLVSADRLLTNEHVVRDRPPDGGDRVIVKFDGRGNVQGTVERESAALDLAMIRLDAGAGLPPALELDPDEAGPGRDIALLGRGYRLFGDLFDLVKGDLKQVVQAARVPRDLQALEAGAADPRLNGVGLYLLELGEKEVIHGMSGSPVFDGTGKVVGIFVGVIIRKGAAPGGGDVRRFFCIPSPVALQFIGGSAPAAPLRVDLVAREPFAAALIPAEPANPGGDARFRAFACRHATDRPLDVARWGQLASSPQRRVAAGAPLDDRLSAALYGRPIGSPSPGTLMRNDAYAYAVVVPDGFQLEETFYTEEKTLVSAYQKPGLGLVRITARKVTWPWAYLTTTPDGQTYLWAHDAPGMLSDLLRKFRRHDLGIRLPDFDDLPGTYDPNEERVDPAAPEWRIGGLNPALNVGNMAWGVTALGGFFYRYYHYEKADEDRSWIVLYVLSDDNLIVVDFQVKTSTLATVEGRRAIGELAVFPLSLLVGPLPK